MSQTVASDRTVRRTISIGKKCLFSLVPLVVLLVIAEASAWILVPSQAGGDRFEQIEQIIVYLGNRPGKSIFEPDSECFWRLKPNVVLPPDGGPAWSGRMSNSHGMRSREVTVREASHRQRILCFGDSSTFAFGVGFDDAWPNQLQELFDDRQPGSVEVLNAGIPGQTTYQGCKRLKRDLVKWKPHIAFITFGNNDGWKWDGQADKEHAFCSKSADRIEVLNHSRAWQWLVSQSRQAASSKAVRQQLDWAARATLNYFDPEERWTPRVSVEDFSANLKAMVDECRDHDCQPVLIVWPDQRQLLQQPTWRPPYQVAMRQVAEETGVPCLDLVPQFEELGEWGIDRFIPNDVVHLDRAGNRFVAEAVARLATLSESTSQMSSR